MKYYVSFPLFYDCDLRCYYCFSADSMRTNMPPKREVTVTAYNKFRQKFFSDAEDIVVELTGGESFLPINNAVVVNFIKRTTTERIELQTNGIQPIDAYKTLLPFKDRLLRIGFTYHRKMIHNVLSYRNTYDSNVLAARDLGLPVYVKELLFHEERDAILENKRRWESLGVEFKIQDFKGSYLGVSKEGVADYTPEDHSLVSNEYVHNLGDCKCKDGYKQLIVMRDGSIISCYIVADIVGNMIDGTYRPNHYVSLMSKSLVWT
jgi:organic radical activating enzyme